jgi:uncharacterized lipoprotein YddW (UPF0748 family)
VEKRGIWYRSDLLPTDYDSGKAKIEEDFKLYEKLKITDVFLLAKGPSDYLYYDTKVGFKNPNFDWDVLKTALEIAAQHGLLIHAWVVVNRNSILISKNPSYAMVDINGNPSSEWSNPAIPEVRSYIFNIIREIIMNYNVKGVHLDYIRYPGSNYSYDNYSRSAFQSEYGFDPLTNPNAPEWAEWRTRQITSQVTVSRAIIKSYNPKIQLSAAVVSPSSARLGVFQDWVDWSNKGLIDFLCPMAYTDSTALFESHVNDIMRNVGGKTEVLAGIGIYLYYNNPKRKDIFLSQINTTRKYKTAGWVLFRDEFLAPFVEFFPELEPKPDVATQAAILGLFTAFLPTMVPVISDFAKTVYVVAEDKLGRLWSEIKERVM